MQSPTTLRRNILKLYVLLKRGLGQLLQDMESKISITFDGWSNSQMRGYTSVTAHWVEESTMNIESTLLSFFHVASGDGQGTRTGQELFRMLRSFDIDTKLL